MNTDEANKHTIQTENTACRQKGKAVLRDIIHRLRRRADDLEKLYDMLPTNPTPEQDEALWEIACSIERP